MIPGDMLFIPPLWIHYIESITPSVQCNARSSYAGVRDQLLENNNRKDSLIYVKNLYGSFADVHQCLLEAQTRSNSSLKTLSFASKEQFHFDPIAI